MAALASKNAPLLWAGLQDFLQFVEKRKLATPDQYSMDALNYSKATSAKSLLLLCSVFLPRLVQVTDVKTKKKAGKHNKYLKQTNIVHDRHPHQFESGKNRHQWEWCSIHKCNTKVAKTGASQMTCTIRKFTSNARNRQSFKRKASCQSWRKHVITAPDAHMHICAYMPYLFWYNTAFFWISRLQVVPSLYTLVRAFHPPHTPLPPPTTLPR